MDTLARGSEQPQSAAYASPAPEALGLKLYTIKQTLDLLSIKRTKLWRLVKDKQLKSIRIGAKRLFTASDIAAFINSRREA